MPTMNHSITAWTAAALLAACAAAPAQQSPPDAAPLYRRAFAEMTKALRDDTDDPVDWPRVETPSIAAYRAAPWPELLRATAVARALFTQAASTRRCSFDRPTGAGVLRDEVQDRVSDFVTMGTFLSAHAWSVLETQPGAALADLEALLSCARHLESQESLWSALMAASQADSALALAEALLSVRGEAAAKPPILRRALAAVEARARSRANPSQLADRSIEDARAMLALQQEDGAQNAAAITAAKDRAIEMLQELLAPMRAAKAGDVEKVRVATERLVAELKSKYDGKKASEVAANGVGEALAAVLATLVAPNAAGLLQQWDDEGARLEELIATLRSRCGLPPRPATGQRKQDR